MYFKTLAATAALCVGFAIPAQAVTFNLIGTIVDIPAPGTSGPAAGTVGTGTFTYNETLLTGMGDEDLAPVGSTIPDIIEDASLAISFTINGVTFTAANDSNAPDFPIFTFEDGILDFISFAVVDGVNGVDLAQFGLVAAGFASTPLFDINENAYLVDIAVLYAPTPVPLPAGLPLLAAGLGAFALVRGKRK